MIDLATLQSCSEITSEHAKQAASSPSEIRVLLKHVSQIAKPGEGCPKVLMAIARLVGQEWVEGDLRIELSGDDVSTTLTVMCDYGVGIRERLVPATRFEVPLDEFERALELAPKLVLPLRITDEDGRLVLTPLLTPETRTYSMAPPDVAVDSTSLGDGERTTAPPPAVPDGYAESDAEHAGRMESGPVPSANHVEPGAEERVSDIHTRPTVRRMVAVDTAAIAAAQRRDPRREEE